MNGKQQAIEYITEMVKYLEARDHSVAFIIDEIPQDVTDSPTTGYYEEYKWSDDDIEFIASMLMKNKRTAITAMAKQHGYDHGEVLAILTKTHILNGTQKKANTDIWARLDKWGVEAA